MTLVWRPGFSGLTDADAIAYVAAVEAADGQALEFGVGKAINDFIVGCKLDGTWNAIKASCILAGARTLAGALVPLVGTAPTNFNFVAGDYNRKTGLVGDGSTKYLNSNRNNNADPQNSKHVSVYATIAGVTSSASYFPTYIGAGRAGSGATNFGITSAGANFYTRNNVTTATNVALPASTGLIGSSRSNSGSYSFYRQQSSISISATSQTPFNGNLFVFGNNVTPFQTDTISNARLAFYSIGESLDLAALNTRVSALITAIGAAIP